MVDGLAQRYGVLPSAILNEDVNMLRIIAIVASGDSHGD
jgi:hypothetical protein